ncbi:methylated-DNA--[protein]-cysteine S-methyltransferase [Nonomuraea africana]|uniref:Methylated-DNA--protein-cysteine methyltransferase n=1 Tax=Nonomuraea africana TaxID=46171 RepID=A0ABR9KBC9_9ACTN|nr:methylated-DNA--[protein]-cysteine S-methyltransferase [Nonomuraea africana]MBE1559324.1 methylated-DNA-[protein]-cysteine S-methyltransferase [Nonomuraea africana]
MTIYTTTGGPLGPLLLTGFKSADGVRLTSLTFATAVRPEWTEDAAAFAEITDRLRAYFDGDLRRFDLPHAVTGTPFQEKVWSAVDDIPYGTTTTYGELAERIGAPRDRIRAVGAAIGANPLLIIRPCHRVIGATGSLTGYAGGLERKRLLLTHEGALQPLFG